MSQAQQGSNAEVKGGAIPYLQVDGAMKAADFYQRTRYTARVRHWSATDQLVALAAKL